MADDNYLIFASAVVFVITLIFGVMPYKNKKAIQ